MKTEMSTNINEQALANTSDQPVADSKGKRSLGLKIRARIGMAVRTNLKTGNTDGMGNSTQCTFGGCSETSIHV